jgi:hypothetical protein
VRNECDFAKECERIITFWGVGTAKLGPPAKNKISRQTLSSRVVDFHGNGVLVVVAGGVQVGSCEKLNLIFRRFGRWLVQLA